MEPSYIIKRKQLPIHRGIIDYAVINPCCNGPRKSIPILLVCGWGSGWTGIRLLGIFLANLGYKVIIPSLPGTGNSFTPNKTELSKEGFAVEARWLRDFWLKFSQKNLSTREFHFVGHSTGCQIGMTMIDEFPEDVVKIVLLSPSGLKKISSFWNKTTFIMKFLQSALEHISFFKQDETLVKIWNESFKKESGAFCSKPRLIQRWSEFQRLCQGKLKKIIQNGVSSKFSGKILMVTGSRDRVFGENIRTYSGTTEVVDLTGYFHNLTMFGSNITAREISRFLNT